MNPYPDDSPQTDAQPYWRPGSRERGQRPVRMRLLPIPEAAGAFLVVFDRVPLAMVAAYGKLADDMKTKVGAQGVLVCPDDIDVPQAHRPLDLPQSTPEGTR